LSDRIATHLDLATTSGGVQPDQVEDLLACLYGLFALVQLHFLQEEENYFTLAETDRCSEVGQRKKTHDRV
jgi:hypothetical protein